MVEGFRVVKNSTCTSITNTPAVTSPIEGFLDTLLLLLLPIVGISLK